MARTIARFGSLCGLIAPLCLAPWMICYPNQAEPLPTSWLRIRHLPWAEEPIGRHPHDDDQQDQADDHRRPDADPDPFRGNLLRLAPGRCVPTSPDCRGLRAARASLPSTSSRETGDSLVGPGRRERSVQRRGLGQQFLAQLGIGKPSAIRLAAGDRRRGRTVVVRQPCRSIQAPSRALRRRPAATRRIAALGRRAGLRQPPGDGRRSARPNGPNRKDRCRRTNPSAAGRPNPRSASQRRKACATSFID